MRLSPRLAIDARRMGPDEITDLLRDALIELGGLDYVDVYARDVKAAAHLEP